jgi:RHS repeat-associated protein
MRGIGTGSGPGQTPGQLCYDADFTPYGQEISYTQSGHLQAPACPPGYKFTGYERDPETAYGATDTGLDYAFARYYSSRLGRLLSVDKMRGAMGSLQSHNAYAYVLNNPLNLTDRAGLCPGDGRGNSQRDRCRAGGEDEPDCMLDGIGTSCAFVADLLLGDAAAQCPGNICEGIDRDGLPVLFVATMIGGGYICQLNGSFDTQQAAGTAAANCGNGLSSVYGTEYEGNIYSIDANGEYSFTTVPGQAHMSPYDPSDIPDGTEYAGFWHTHQYYVPINEQFSDPDLQTVNRIENVLFPSYLGTPEGRILMYDPIQSLQFPNGCVLQGSPVSALPQGARPSIPACQ